MGDLMRTLKSFLVESMVTPVWMLPIRIKFNILAFAFRAVQGTGPDYIQLPLRRPPGSGLNDKLVSGQFSSDP
jgi:hypothetical protein